jgi:hypothetical protein
VNVHPEDPFPICARKILDFSKLLNANICAEHAARSKLVFDLPSEVRNRRFIAGIEGHGDSPTGFARRGINLFCNGSGVIENNIGDGNPRSCGGESTSQGSTEAGAGAGDDGN